MDRVEQSPTHSQELLILYMCYFKKSVGLKKGSNDRPHHKWWIVIVAAAAADASKLRNYDRDSPALAAPVPREALPLAPRRSKFSTKMAD